MTRAQTFRLLQNYAVLILIAALIVILSTLSDSFLTGRNLLNILNQNAPLAIMAAAMTLVIFRIYPIISGLLGSLALIAGGIHLHPQGESTEDQPSS